LKTGEYLKGLKEMKLNKLTLALITAFTITACGSSSDKKKIDEVINSGDFINITVVDGYLENSQVFIDVNGNYIADDSEPKGVTDNLGKVSLNVTSLENYSTYPVVVKALAGETKDSDHQTVIDNDFILVTPGGQQTVISPITSLVNLIIESGQASNLDEAQALIQAKLFLPENTNLYADYLAASSNDKYVHAIARNLVQVFPKVPEDIKGENNKLDALLTASSVIANVIATQTDEETDLDSIVVDFDPETGNAEVKELTVEDAKAFVADVRTWGREIESELSTGADGFKNRLKTASEFVDDDAQILFDMAGEVLSAVSEAFETDSIDSLVIEDIYPNLQGSISLENKQILIDVNADDKKLQFLVKVSLDDITNIEEFSIEPSGILESNKVRFELTSESKFQIIKHTTLDLNTIDYKLAVSAKTKPTQGEIAEFFGLIALSSVIVESDIQAKVEIDKIELQGQFKLGDELFNAYLNLEATPKLEDEVIWSDLNGELLIEANFMESENAKIRLTYIGDTEEEVIAKLELMYGERSVILDFNQFEESGMLKVTNSAGIIMAINVKPDDVTSESFIGVITLGSKQIGTLSLVNGQYKITYIDGSFESLF